MAEKGWQRRRVRSATLLRIAGLSIGIIVGSILAIGLASFDSAQSSDLGG